MCPTLQDTLAGMMCQAGCFVQECASPTSLSEQSQPCTSKGPAFSWLKLHHLSFSKADIPSSDPDSTLSGLFQDLVSSTTQWLVVLKDLREPFLSQARTHRLWTWQTHPPTLHVRLGATLQLCGKLLPWLCSLGARFEPQQGNALSPLPCTGLLCSLNGAP